MIKTLLLSAAAVALPFRHCPPRRARRRRARHARLHDRRRHRLHHRLEEGSALHLQSRRPDLRARKLFRRGQQMGHRHRHDRPGRHALAGAGAEQQHLRARRAGRRLCRRQRRGDRGGRRRRQPSGRRPRTAPSPCSRSACRRRPASTSRSASPGSSCAASRTDGHGDSPIRRPRDRCVAPRS